MPNVSSDPLALAHARMRVATVEQLREALEAQARGENIGVFALAIAPFLALGVAA